MNSNSSNQKSANNMQTEQRGYKPNQTSVQVKPPKGGTSNNKK